MAAASELDRARAQALLLLKFRPRSEAELKDRLLKKRFGPALVDSLLEELKKKGFIDDEKFARLFAAGQMSSRPVARKVLVSRLKSKGVSPETAALAVAESAGEEDDLETARRLARERAACLKGLDLQACRRRLFGFLSRRGFSSEIGYRVVREVTAAGVSRGDDEER